MQRIHHLTACANFRSHFNSLNPFDRPIFIIGKYQQYGCILYIEAFYMKYKFLREELTIEDTNKI